MSHFADDRAHDVLAAEEFTVPAGDPSLRREAPHDVLVADEFAMGTRDPALAHAPVQLPAEPYPAAEAHDVLAAEEFAMPAGRVAVAPRTGAGGGAARRGRLLVAGALAGVAAVLVRRRGSSA